MDSSQYSATRRAPEPVINGVKLYNSYKEGEITPGKPINEAIYTGYNPK